MLHTISRIALRGWAILFLLWTLGAVVWFVDRSGVLSQKSGLVLSRVKEGEGKAWRYVPTAEQVRDQKRWQEALILEDGRVLGHRFQDKDVVIQWGDGYAITPRNLWFAASDHRDPRVNGRKYEIAMPYFIPSAWRTILDRAWAWSGLLLAMLLWREALAKGLSTMLRSNFWRFVLLVALLRMVLVSCDEIMLAGDDELDYVRLANGWYYGVSGVWYGRLPVYPLFVALVSTTGLPLRLVIEGVQIFAYAFLAGAMLRCGISRWVAGVSFAWMTLSPQTAQWNNYTITDTLYPALLFAVISFGLFWIITARWGHALMAGILLGLTMDLREERVVALGLAFLLVSVAVVKGWWEIRRAGWDGGACWRRLRPMAFSAALMVGVCGIIDTAFQALFLARTGVWAHCLLSTPGMNALMDSLYRIPCQGTPRKYFLIDKKVRDFASSLSPTFRDRQHFYENEEMGWRKVSMRDHGVYDLDTSNIVWCTLQEDVFADGREDDFAYSDQMMLKAAKEIRAGLSGKSQQRIFLTGTFPINETVVGLLWGNGGSLLTECLKDYTFPPPKVGPLGMQEVDAEAVELYDRLAHRRTSLKTVADTTSDPRPNWIKKSWLLLYEVETLSLWLAIAGLVGMTGWALWNGVRRRPLWRPVPFMPAVMFLLLAFVGATRLVFGTLVLVYYGSHVRYMIPFALVSLPLLLILIDLLASWIHRTGPDFSARHAKAEAVGS